MGLLSSPRLAAGSGSPCHEWRQAYPTIPRWTRRQGEAKNRIPQHARRPAPRPGPASRARGKRSKVGTDEYGGHGPVGTTAIPGVRDAIGAMRVRKLPTSDRGTRKATDPATLLPPPADR